MTAPAPYKRTPDFDEVSLPDGLRNAHSTKAGVWGLLVVAEGEVQLVFEGDAGRTITVSPGKPGVIAPEAPHHVEVAGPMRMHVEFYREKPRPAD